jgi:uncharacterized protein (TIGR02099 family)
VAGAHAEESLPLRGLHALAPWAWRLLVAGVVLLAIYVAAGRYLMSEVAALRDPLLTALNARLPFTVSVAQLSGSWSAFSPELHVHDLRLAPGDGDLQPIVIRRGTLCLDIPASIASGTLQLSRLEIVGLGLDAGLTEEGSIEISGFSGGGGAALQAWLEEFLPNVERVLLAENRLDLAAPGGSIELLLDLSLTREGNARRLQGQINADKLALALNAEGVGNPLKPLSWTGDIYIDAQSGDLAGLSELLDRNVLPVRLEGAAAMQFWLTRADGDSTALLRWNSEELRVDERSGAWSLPIDALSFEAALEQRDRHWSLLAEDFHLERSGQILDLDRTQFDWWGQALRVRASDLGLAALPTLLSAAPGLPEGLREALPELAPAGDVPAIELRLDDLADPANSWQLRASLDNLQVDSWRGAPALAGVTGYLELGSQGGSLQLDSRDFSMHFPKIYHRALEYEEARGQLFFTWHSGGLRIDSGLMHARGAEGAARGLFAVDIPFVPRVTGVELELLIGLEESRVEYRNKYLPYTLPQPLLDWLGRSLPAGNVDSAGFVFRGSTKAMNREHMTVQLYLDASDATLAYDPQWPALSELDAQVWVDDGRTLARAKKARSDGAQISDLMLSVVPQPGGARLDVAGGMAGDAASAGRLLAESPLRDLTSGVFADWQYGGPVSGELALRVFLGEQAPPPRVQLDLALENVDIEIDPLALPVSGINGQVRYASARGFAGSHASGNALGGTLEVTAGESEAEVIALGLAGQIDAQSVAHWLEMPLFEFASGRTAVTGEIRIDGQGSSQLSLVTDLEGVALDLPSPFGKSADQPLPLQLDVPLMPDPVLAIALGERLLFDLALEEGSLKRLVAAVGGQAPDVAACDQRYCLAGTLSTLDIAAWGDFYQRYLTQADDEAGSDTVDAGAALPFSYRVDSLDVGELRLGSRSFGEARIDLWGIDQLWQGAVESSLLQGNLTREGDDLQLLIEYIDLDRFDGDGPVALADVRGLLPSMRVDVLEVRGGDRLLGNLGFDLDMSQSDGALYAANLSGTLWNMRLDAPRAGMLRWSDASGADLSSLELDATFDDAGDVLEAAGYAPTLESDSGRASVRMQWPGGPSAFKARNARGQVTVDVRDGRIIESSKGALAVISFLNFAEILRGLSLSHMFESGIPFITAGAEFNLHAGTVEISDLHIDGAASAFEFSGLSDLRDNRIDGELLVTLPVANNLPWVAALAGGLPVAAGVFVVSKVFEKQVNRMSSAVYRVSGNVEAPEVEFRRLFDNKLNPVPEAPAGSGTGGG